MSKGKSTLTQDDIKHLAKLSNLRIDDAELEHYPEQLSESLAFIENLSELDVTDVPETFYTTDALNVMDEDVVDESVMIPHKDVVKNARGTRNGYFIVKRIL